MPTKIERETKRETSRTPRAPTLPPQDLSARDRDKPTLRETPATQAKDSAETPTMVNTTALTKTTPVNKS